MSSDVSSCVAVNTDINKKHNKPFKVLVCAVTLMAFFVNIFSYDLAFAASAPLEVTHAGTAKTPDVGTFVLPQYLGHIKDQYKTASDKIVIHIQDAHCNYAAQNTISNIIEYLNKEYGINTVNLEGGEGDYDLSVFNRVKDDAIKRKAADYFLKEGEINAAEFYTINNPDKVKLWGVEDTDIYLDNLNVYRESLKNKDDIYKSVKILNYALNSLKFKIYSRDLLALSQKFANFKEKTVELKDYIGYLTELAKNKNTDISDLKNVGILNKAFLLEKGIDFKRANLERDQLIDKLNKCLSKNEVTELVQKAVEFKINHIAPIEFYAYLAGKAKELMLDLSGYRNLNLYIGYISLYSTLKNEELFKEIEAIEDRIKDKLWRNDDEKELDRLSGHLCIIKNLLNITLTQDEFKYYEENKKDFDIAGFTRFINKAAAKYGLNLSANGDLNRLNSYVRDMEKFYSLSRKRDEEFVKKLKGLSPKGTVPKATVLITGGFHTENLTKLLKKKGISYISIMPNFGLDGKESPYLKLLAGNGSIFKKHVRVDASTLAYYTHFVKESPAVHGAEDTVRCVGGVAEALGSGKMLEAPETEDNRGGSKGAAPSSPPASSKIFLFGLILWVSDQLTKSIIKLLLPVRIILGRLHELTILDMRSDVKWIIKDIIGIDHVHHLGSIVDILPHIILLSIAVAVTWIAGVTVKRPTKLTYLGLCLTIGGLLGTITDIILYGYVVDWLVIAPIGTTNISDIFIPGVLLLGLVSAVYVWRILDRLILGGEDGPKGAAPSPSSEAEPPESRSSASGSEPEGVSPNDTSPISPEFSESRRKFLKRLGIFAILGIAAPRVGLNSLIDGANAAQRASITKTQEELVGELKKLVLELKKANEPSADVMEKMLRQFEENLAKGIPVFTRDYIPGIQGFIARTRIAATDESGKITNRYLMLDWEFFRGLFQRVKKFKGRAAFYKHIAKGILITEAAHYAGDSDIGRNVTNRANLRAAFLELNKISNMEGRLYFTDEEVFREVIRHVVAKEIVIEANGFSALYNYFIRHGIRPKTFKDIIEAETRDGVKDVVHKALELMLQPVKMVFNNKGNGFDERMLRLVVLQTFSDRSAGTKADERDYLAAAINRATELEIEEGRAEKSTGTPPRNKYIEIGGYEGRRVPPADYFGFLIDRKYYDPDTRYTETLPVSLDRIKVSSGHTAITIEREKMGWIIYGYSAPSPHASFWEAIDTRTGIIRTRGGSNPNINEYKPSGITRYLRPDYSIIRQTEQKDAYIGVKGLMLDRFNEALKWQGITASQKETLNRLKDIFVTETNGTTRGSPKGAAPLPSYEAEPPKSRASASGKEEAGVSPEEVSSESVIKAADLNFISDRELRVPRFSLTRAWRHRLNLWKDRAALEIPLVITDHAILIVLPFIPILLAIGTRSLLYAVLGVKAGPLDLLCIILTGLTSYSCILGLGHIGQTLDGLVVLNNARRYKADPENAILDNRLLRLVKKFEKETGWDIAWTDNPYLLSRAEPDRKRVILNIGWISADTRLKRERRLPYLNSVFRTIRHSIQDNAPSAGSVSHQAASVETSSEPASGENSAPTSAIEKTEADRQARVSFAVDESAELAAAADESAHVVPPLTRKEKRFVRFVNGINHKAGYKWRLNWKTVEDVERKLRTAGDGRPRGDSAVFYRAHNDSGSFSFGGDGYFDYLFSNGMRMAGVIDISGHDRFSALIKTALLLWMDEEVEKLEEGHFSNPKLMLEDACAFFDDKLADILNRKSFFEFESEFKSRLVAIELALIDPKTMKLYHLPSGHSSVLYRGAAGDIEVENRVNPALGIRHGDKFEIHEKDITDLSTVSFFTDGCYEIRTSEGRRKDVLGDIVSAVKESPSDLQKILGAVTSWVPAEGMSDDAAAMVIDIEALRIKNGARRASAPRQSASGQADKRLYTDPISETDVAGLYKARKKNPAICDEAMLLMKLAAAITGYSRIVFDKDWFVSQLEREGVADLGRYIDGLFDEHGFVWPEKRAKAEKLFNRIAAAMPRRLKPEGDMHTYLDRYQNAHNYFKETVVPAVVSEKLEMGGRSITISVIGCSTGEEMASLYYYLHRAFENNPNWGPIGAWQIRIKGIDIAKEAVREARKKLVKEPKALFFNYLSGGEKEKILELMKEIPPETRKQIFSVTHGNISYEPERRAFLSGSDVVAADNILHQMITDSTEKVAHDLVKYPAWILTNHLEVFEESGEERRGVERKEDLPYAPLHSVYYALAPPGDKDTRLESDIHNVTLNDESAVKELFDYPGYFLPTHINYNSLLQRRDYNRPLHVTGLIKAIKDKRVRLSTTVILGLRQVADTDNAVFNRYRDFASQILDAVSYTESTFVTSRASASGATSPEPVLHKNRILIENMILPKSRFGGDNVNIAKVLESACEETLSQDNLKEKFGSPLISIIGSLSYALTEEGTPDWEAVEDLDFRIYSKKALSSYLQEDIAANFFEKLNSLGVKVLTESDDVNDWVVIDGEKNKRLKAQFLFGETWNLFHVTREALSYRLTDIFFGNIDMLNEEFKKAGISGAVERTAIFYEKTLMAIKKENGKVKTGRFAYVLAPKVLKELYQLFYIRGLSSKGRWLLEKYKEFKKENGYDAEKWQDAFDRAIRELDIDGDGLRKELRAEMLSHATAHFRASASGSKPEGVSPATPIWADRTMLIQDPDDPDGYIACKFAREDETGANLLAETKLEQEGINMAIGLNILGDSPEIIRAQDGSYVQQFTGNLSNLPKGTNLNSNKYYVKYKAKKSYFTYLNDQGLTYDQILTASKKNLFDLVKLFKAGYIHTSLCYLSHAEGRKWQWDHIAGTGDTNNLEEYLRYPNLRLNGLADFEHIETIEYKDIRHYLGQNLSEFIVVIIESGIINKLSDTQIYEALKTSLEGLFNDLGLTQDISASIKTDLRTFITNFRTQYNEHSGVDNNNIEFLVSAVNGIMDKVIASSYYNLRNLSFETFGTKGQGINNFSYPESATQLQDGRILIIDRDNHRTVVLNPDLTWNSSFGTDGYGIGKFAYPTGATQLQDGRILIVDENNHRIVVLNPDLTWNSSFGTYGSGEGNFIHPVGATQLQDGRILIVDRNNNRIVALNPDLTWNSSFGTYGQGIGNFDWPVGATQLQDGRILIVDENNHRIVALNPDLTWNSSFGTYGRGIGNFIWPTGPTQLQDGRVLIMDRDNNRIVALDSSDIDPSRSVDEILQAIEGEISKPAPNDLKVQLASVTLNTLSQRESSNSYGRYDVSRAALDKIASSLGLETGARELTLRSGIILISKDNPAYIEAIKDGPKGTVPARASASVHRSFAGDSVLQSEGGSGISDEGVSPNDTSPIFTYNKSPLADPETRKKIHTVVIVDTSGKLGASVSFVSRLISSIKNTFGEKTRIDYVGLSKNLSLFEGEVNRIEEAEEIKEGLIKSQIAPAEPEGLYDLAIVSSSYPDLFGIQGERQVTIYDYGSQAMGNEATYYDEKGNEKKYKIKAENQYEAIDRFFNELGLEKPICPSISVLKRNIDIANAELSAKGIAKDEQYILLNPLGAGSTGYRPFLSRENWVEVVYNIAKRTGVRIVIQGPDMPIVKGIYKGVRKKYGKKAAEKIVIIRYGDLGFLKALSYRALAVVTVDTGVYHVASALGKPFFVFGFRRDLKKWFPQNLPKTAASFTELDGDGDENVLDENRMPLIIEQVTDFLGRVNGSVSHQAASVETPSKLSARENSARRESASGRKVEVTNIPIEGIKRITIRTEKRGVLHEPTEKSIFLNTGALTLADMELLFERSVAREAMGQNGTPLSVITLSIRDQETGKIKIIDEDMLVPDPASDIKALEDPRVYERDGWVRVSLTVVKKDGSYYSAMTKHRTERFLEILNERREDNKDTPWEWSGFQKTIKREGRYKNFVPFCDPAEIDGKEIFYALYRTDEQKNIIWLAKSENGLDGPWEDAGMFMKMDPSKGWLGGSVSVTGIPELPGRPPINIAFFHEAAEKQFGEAISKYYDIRMAISDRNNPETKCETPPVLIPEPGREYETVSPANGIKLWMPGTVYTCGAILKEWHYDGRKCEYVIDIYYSGSDTAILWATSYVTIEYAIAKPQVPTETQVGQPAEVSEEDSQNELLKSLFGVLSDVRPPEEPRIFFMPVKDGNLSPYNAARANVLHAFHGANFDNVKMVFYNGTEEDLMNVYAKAIADPGNSGALCLAYVDSNHIDEGALREHNQKSAAFKWIRENLPAGVSVKELFMHVAFGLPVLDYVKNSSDSEHKKKLLAIIERMVDNDEKDMDLLKADLNNIFVSGFVLLLKIITKIDINKEIRDGRRSLEEVLSAA